jgi:hypothetical protein
VKAIFLVVFSLGSLTVQIRGQTNDGVLGTARLGARLFLETRFSRFFFANSGGDANFRLAAGDPVMNTTATTFGSLPGPFAGQSMNCRACHLVAEQQGTSIRTYADFAARSPVPANGDGKSQTPRNSMSLVNSLLPHQTPLFLHFDGEFVSPQDLILSTLTGRNFGWKPTESALAISHIVRIIRGDNGTNTLAQQYGGVPYAEVFAGSGEVPTQYQISPSYRLYNVAVTNSADPNYVSDARILQDVVALIQVYLTTLTSPTDTNGLFNGSPYDVFLVKNGLPRTPAPNETPLEYSQRLLRAIAGLTNPQFVSDPADGHFQTHQQIFQFGQTELSGLRIFFAQPGQATQGEPQTAIGNCVTCHTAPAFTDFLFHNTGVAQEEYESVHGPGSFLTLYVPELEIRQGNYDAFLPATTNHPNATGSFRTPPTFNQVQQGDLGLWNVFANPDFPAVQDELQAVLPQLISMSAARISEFTVDGDELILRCTNGVSGGTCYVLASTNLLSQPTDWRAISTNTFDALGHLDFTNTLSKNVGEFFRLSAQAPPPSIALPRMIALFKTPNLRNLGSSDPYFHSGRMNTLENVVSFYQKFSGLARIGGVRNAAPELSAITLDNSAILPLAAFLRSLNEDFFDPLVSSGTTASTGSLPTGSH